MRRIPSLDDVRDSGKAGMSRALALIERHPDDPQVLNLLDQAYARQAGRVIGLTGPPGVGKSTLTGALIGAHRQAGFSVGCIAVDPSSRRSGGALLGDRMRIETDPEDGQVFVRSMAARDRLGGLAGLTIASMVLMRAVYDVVLIETVGVGQSETDVVGVADTIVFCVQPGSGDSLQFMKAGIAEIPHICVVTKSDLGSPARRAASDLEGVLTLATDRPHGWRVPVKRVSVLHGEGLAELMDTIGDHWHHLTKGDLLARSRTAQAQYWFEESVRERFGREGLKKAGDLSLREGESPFLAMHRLAGKLLTR